MDATLKATIACIWSPIKLLLLLFFWVIIQFIDNIKEPCFSTWSVIIFREFIQQFFNFYRKTLSLNLLMTKLVKPQREVTQTFGKTFYTKLKISVNLSPKYLKFVSCNSFFIHSINVIIFAIWLDTDCPWNIWNLCADTKI